MSAVGSGLSRGSCRLYAATAKHLSPAPNGTAGVVRKYATQSTLGSKPGQSSSTSHRRQITVTGDDGRVPWWELSTKEKAVRGTQQTFNFAIVLAGAAGTVSNTTRALESSFSDFISRRWSLISCTPSFLLPIARPANSITPSTELRTTSAASTC